MVELSPRQMQVMERLFEVGFGPIANPPGERAMRIMTRNSVTARAPVPDAGLKLVAPASYLIGGNFGVKLKRGSGEVFVWKKKEVETTPESVRELESFRAELQEILESPPKQ